MRKIKKFHRNSLPAQSKPHPEIIVRKHYFFLCFFILAFVLNTSFQYGTYEKEPARPEQLDPGTINGLLYTVSDTALIVLQGEEIPLSRLVRQYYVISDFRPSWTTRNHLNHDGTALLRLLENAREYGLNPDQYHLEALRSLTFRAGKNENDSKDGNREKTEILLTHAALKFMINLHEGYIPFDTALCSAARLGNLTQILLKGVRHKRTIESIVSVQPRFIEYIRLQKATALFVRKTELTDNWQNISWAEEDTTMFLGQVKQILVKLGYVDNNCRNAEIIEGLKSFQLHHGFEADGKPGKNTIAALKMTSFYRYRMLSLNLDRLRKQDNSDEHLLYVNIPAYHLKIFRSNRPVDTYRVIVGNPKTPTPLITSRVERIIANPVWDVPQSITMNELLPKIKADTGYMKRNRFRLVDKNKNTVRYENLDPEKMMDEETGYMLRQDAGSDNALGRVKFIFSNPYAVYLHDTPSKSLFLKDTRALSHGCIRIQYPEKLADYIVKVIQSDSMDINSMIERGIHREINLVKAIPIHIGYITCDADEKGDLYFYQDIYGTDQEELVNLSSLMGI